MGRKLYRVPLDFNWPLNKTWTGFLNPHYVNCHKCPACAGSGYSPEAKHFHDQWYGKAHFDPVAYGATPLTVDHPKIRENAVRNVQNAPDFYLTPAERAAEKNDLIRASVDLMELHQAKSNDQLKAELDAPADLEDLEEPGLIRIGKHREAAIAREQRRLFEVCYANQWCHHLIQADVDALVAEGRLRGFTHRPRTEEQRAALEASSQHWMSEWNGYTPTAQEVNDWSLQGMGHDSINTSVCIEARCTRENVPLKCDKCDGAGDHWTSPEAEAACEAWEKQDPPKGDGYQLWETTSEGSPISPVFETIEELCDYAAANCSTFASFTATADEWRAMLDKDFVHARMGNVVLL